MKQRIILVLLLLLPVLLATACTYSSEDAQTQGHVSESIEGTTPDDWPEQMTMLELQYSYFRITNASGETLIYDEAGLHGSMEVESQNTVIGGSQYASKLTLRVANSDYFIYENLSDGSTSFSVRAKNCYGSVRGSGLQTVTVSTKDKSVSVNGVNMDYNAKLRIGVENYEYFILEGENEGAFSMRKAGLGVELSNVEGTQKVSFANAEWKQGTAVELNFTGEEKFDLSQVVTNDTIKFSTYGSSKSELTIVAQDRDLRTETDS